MKVLRLEEVDHIILHFALPRCPCPPNQVKWNKLIANIALAHFPQLTRSHRDEDLNIATGFGIVVVVTHLKAKSRNLFAERLTSLPPRVLIEKLASEFRFLSLVV